MTSDMRPVDKKIVFEWVDQVTHVGYVIRKDTFKDNSEIDSVSIQDCEDSIPIGIEVLSAVITALQNVLHDHINWKAQQPDEERIMTTTAKTGTMITHGEAPPIHYYNCTKVYVNITGAVDFIGEQGPEGSRKSYQLGGHFVIQKDLVDEPEVSR